VNPLVLGVGLGVNLVNPLGFGVGLGVNPVNPQLQPEKRHSWAV